VSALGAQEQLPVARPGLVMTRAEFDGLAAFIYQECGVKLSPGKQSMLASRLTRRLRALGMDCFGDYHAYVSSPEGRRVELARMIDEVTTNKTDFFREPAHFDFLTKTAVPAVLRLGGSGELAVWSAACSTGEEPYTIAMVLAELREGRRGLRPSILASDINETVLGKAVQAIYPAELARPIPNPLRRKFVMEGKGSQAGYVRIAPEIRRMVTFRRLNLMDQEYHLGRSMHIVFCRNVIIYFDRETQVELFRRILGVMRPGGYLFIGHTESLTGINDDFQRVGPAVYQAPSAA